ncbi:MAG: 6-phosphogluconolactonase [Paracoccaceae bacterium]
MELIEYPDAELMMLRVADAVAGELRSYLDRQDRASLVVPGGTTPGPIFDSLSGVDLDWARVMVALSDERWVPETSERSNTRLIRERLLVGPAAAATYLPLHADAPEPEDALEALAEGLAPALPISVLLLGMGADMHTASIFPGADRLDEALTTERTLVPMRAPGAPEPRVTLSAHVLKDAMSTHLILVGDAKRAALDLARELPPREAPVAAILPGATVHWARE